MWVSGEKRDIRTRTDDTAPDNLSDLQVYLAQLVGEPFRFARVSYGDELTLHFGDLRPSRSPKVGKFFLRGVHPRCPGVGLGSEGRDKPVDALARG